MTRKFLGGKPVVGTGSDEVVVETLTITATDPVLIDNTTSADLSANRTISVKAANTSGQAGVVSLTDSTSTTSSTVAATATAVKAAKDAADAKVPTTRTISTTAPLTGGGDLSANRTFAINDGTTAQKGAVQLSDSTSTNASTKAATEKAVYETKLVADAAIAKSLVTTIGDLIIGAGSPAIPTRLGIGANTYVLTSDGTTASWAAPSGGGGGSTKQEAFGSITSTSGTIDYDYTTATVFYHTSSPTADWTVNFTNVPTTNSYAYNYTIVVPQGGTAYKVTAAQIAGSSATIKWAGSTAAPAGNNSKTDVWVFSLFRVSGAWTVLGVQSANFG